MRLVGFWCVCERDGEKVRTELFAKGVPCALSHAIKPDVRKEITAFERKHFVNPNGKVMPMH